MICFNESSSLFLFLNLALFHYVVIEKLGRVSSRANVDQKTVCFIGNIRLEDVQGEVVGLKFDNG